MKRIRNKLAESWCRFEERSIDKMASFLGRSSGEEKPVQESVEPVESTPRNIRPVVVKLPPKSKPVTRAKGKDRKPRKRSRAVMTNTTVAPGYGFVKTVGIAVGVLFFIAVIVALSDGVGGSSGNEDVKAGQSSAIQVRQRDALAGTPEALRELDDLSMAEYMRKYGLTEDQYLVTLRQQLKKYRSLYGEHKAVARRDVRSDRSATRQRPEVDRDAQRRSALLARLRKARAVAAGDDAETATIEKSRGSALVEDASDADQTIGEQVDRSQLKWYER